ncbi:MAG: HU family DNA-binding protein [Desulfovibrio sp.]|jgi:DNA-binding protein HU-beta|nr:HU family DNA-binding protein [Desulfovibrio sp.]
MTKAEFIRAVEVELDENKASPALIGRVLTAAGAVSLGLLKDGQGVSLLGLGSLKAVKRAAREGRNPQTGAALKIPAHNAVKFSAGKALKDTLKG